jgi:lipopolysaccharide transport system ATP-binding protein
MGDVSKGEGRTVLFVSHNMAAVKTLCNSGIVLEKGHIVFTGGSEEASNFYLINNFQKAEQTLSERSDRKGDGRFRVQKIRAVNANGEEVSDLILGEPCSFLFDYATSGDVKASEFTVVVQVFDQMERLMTTFASDELGSKFTDLGTSGTLQISLPQLHLRGGSYYLNFMISEKRSFNSPHHVLDYLSHAMVFNVLSADLYQSGVILRNNGYFEGNSITVFPNR